MRRRFSAPHGFAVNGNLNKVVDFDAPYLQLAPRQPLGNHAGRLAVYKPFTGSPGVLLITTQGRPAHLTCGQTIACIIISRPRLWQKGQLRPLSGQNESLKAKQRKLPSQRREAACGWACPSAFSEARILRPFQSLAQAGTYPHGWCSFFKLQVNVFFPVHPIAQEKGRIVT